MPITVPLLIPFELIEPWPRVGSAVADGGVLIIVLTWPVTVVTMVMASVATVAVLGGGLGLGSRLGPGVGVGEAEVASVLDCAWYHTRISTKL